MTKTLQKISIEGTYLNIVKIIYDEPTENIIFNGEKLNAFLLRSGSQVSNFTTITQHSFGSSSYSNQRRKRNKRNPDWKRSKALTGDMMPYLENSKDSIRKLLELISEFNKIAGYKSIHRKHLHFYILTMKKSEREIKVSIPFTIATKRIKY